MCICLRPTMSRLYHEALNLYLKLLIIGNKEQEFPLHHKSAFWNYYSMQFAMFSYKYISWHHPITCQLSVELMFVLSSGVLVLLVDCILRLAMLAANQKLHSFILHAVLFAPLAFTDTTPLGRILSRFAKDMDVLDNQLPWEISDLLYCFFEVRYT